MNAAQQPGSVWAQGEGPKPVSTVGKPADEPSINTYAKELALKKPDVQAIISADKDTPHGKVVAIIDAVKSGGVKKFAITIDKK